MSATRPRTRDWYFLAVYFVGSGLLAALSFPRDLHHDVRLSIGQSEQTTGRIIAVTGTRKLTLPPRKVVDGKAMPPGLGSPVRLHRYDYEFELSDGRLYHGASFSGGGCYALDDRAGIRYVPSRPELSRAAGTTMDPMPFRALLILFPLLGIGILIRMLAGRRKA